MANITYKEINTDISIREETPEIELRNIFAENFFQFWTVPHNKYTNQIKRQHRRSKA